MLHSSFPDFRDICNFSIKYNESFLLVACIIGARFVFLEYVKIKRKKITYLNMYFYIMYVD